MAETLSFQAANDSMDVIEPLLSNNTDNEDEENNVEKSNNKYVSLKALVIGIFAVIIFIVLFGILYSKLAKTEADSLPKWPNPSHSYLGEYSTAAVAADNELCSDIGRDILLQGGNVVDSAIATLFCIGIMDTQSAGLGGGHFMTIYNATTKRCHVVDAREVAPLAASENMYKDRWNKSRYGWEAVAVPGELHGLWTEYIKFGSGKVSWKSLINPTILLMQEGYPTSQALASALQTFENKILKEKTMRLHFVNPKTGKVYKVGEQINTRTNFLNTLKNIADSSNPVKEFYTGYIMKAMVKEFKENGGLLTEDDFVNYKSKIRSDDDVIYTLLGKDQRQICGPPPPSGSAITQSILNIMSGLSFNLSTFDGNTDLYHSFIEASKFSYAVRSKLGDMDFLPNASAIAKHITTAEWAKLIRSKITLKSHCDEYYGGSFAASEDHGTSHISIVDKEGNAVSVTSTINLILGALVMSESTGILWNDEMDDFSSPGHPNYFGYLPTPANYIRPGKRPMSSMSPLVIFNNQTSEVLAIGGSGGSVIMTGVASSALHNQLFNYDIKQSIDFPRLHNQLQPNITYAEKKWPSKYIDALKQRGHTFNFFDSLTVVTAVQKLANKTVFANSDYRKGTDSEPAGY